MAKNGEQEEGKKETLLAVKIGSAGGGSCFSLSPVFYARFPARLLNSCSD